MQADYDVIIAGAGVAGMVTAASTAKHSNQNIQCLSCCEALSRVSMVGQAVEAPILLDGARVYLAHAQRRIRLGLESCKSSRSNPHELDIYQ